MSILFKFVIKHQWLIMAIMLLICLLDMPYGYYQLVRFVAMVVFGINAYNYHNSGDNSLMITMAVFVLLFQPFFPFALGRILWNIVDFLVAVFLIYLWYKEVLIRVDRS